MEIVTKNKGGRPTKYSKKIAKVICDLIADGLSLRQICSNEGLPSRSTVNDWLSKKHGFNKQYVAAKMVCADLFADEIIEIADDGSRDYTKDKDGRMVPDFDHIQRSRLRVDARKFIISKLAPKKYGDKQDINLTNPINLVMESKDANTL